MENPNIQKVSNFYIYKIVLVASMGGFLFGYDGTIIAGALSFLVDHFQLSPSMKGFAVSSMLLGAILGPLVGLLLSEKLGRRKTMMIAGICFMISAIGSALAFTIWDFYAWRFLGGIGIGLSMITSPMYIAELSPPKKRGVLININQLSNVFGILLAVVISYLFSFYTEGWRWMFGSAIIPIIILIIGLLLVPESPRWLTARNRIKEAFKILTKINGAELANNEIVEIQDELKRENGEFRELFQPGMKVALFIGIVLMIFSQINGVNLMLLYSPTILAEAGVHVGSSAILSAVPIFIFIFICTIAAFELINRFSRRGLLITSILFMALGHIIMAINLYLHWPPLMSLIPMSIATGAFTLGFAPLSWVIIAEIFPNRIRSKAMAVACFFTFGSAFIVDQLFPMVTHWLSNYFNTSAGVYLIFAGICFIAAVFSWKMVPETKGLSLEKISEFWLNHNNGKSISTSNHKSIVWNIFKRSYNERQND